MNNRTNGKLGLEAIIRKASTALALGSTLAISTPTFAQNNDPIPNPKVIPLGVDQDGVLHLEVQELVPGQFYMPGVQTENLDTSQKFMAAMGTPYYAVDTNALFFTVAPQYFSKAFYIMEHFPITDTSFNFTDYDVISNNFTFTATTGTNCPFTDNFLMYDDTTITAGETNFLSATFDTRTRFNDLHAITSVQAIPGNNHIDGWELYYSARWGVFVTDNRLSADYPLQFASELNSQPAWNFLGTPGEAYSVSFSSISTNGVTNLISSSIVDSSATAANGGGFSYVFDRANDPMTPSYELSVDWIPTNGVPTNEFKLLVGNIRSKAKNSWLHVDEHFNGWPYSKAFDAVYPEHSEMAGLVELLYPLDWDNIYLITQTKHPYSPMILDNQSEVTGYFLDALRIEGKSDSSQYLTSFLTIFCHGNNEDLIGGSGSPISEADGISYQDFARARQTEIDPHTGRMVYTFGAMGAAIIEACNSAEPESPTSSMQGYPLFSALGIYWDDDPGAFPNWGKGAKGHWSAFRMFAHSKYTKQVCEDWVSPFAPQIADSISANWWMFPWEHLLTRYLGCMHAQYAGRNIATDLGYHNSSMIYWPPTTNTAPVINGTNQDTRSFELLTSEKNLKNSRPAYFFPSK